MEGSIAGREGCQAQGATEEERKVSWAVPPLTDRQAVGGSGLRLCCWMPSGPVAEPPV